MAMARQITQEVFEEVAAERDRQDVKWGYPRTQLSNFEWMTILTEETGEAAEACLHLRYGSAITRADLIKEVTHVAAVAVAWLEHLCIAEELDR